ncbi:hypothetical protein CISG_04343 [Coccidioides immitis RMSCC 3703]|uniref:Aminoglycoside phosphotransferase domain-containing protein n=1 Tax=Coccidioides immitis RMSCC 3703 TaxID=454286 RepID=A0A0J8QRC1_COCIT|nr:hypothetical protein CISG_04343 [Coccidioides immitis RMSCC 3703]
MVRVEPCALSALVTLFCFTWWTNFDQGSSVPATQTFSGATSVTCVTPLRDLWMLAERHCPYCPVHNVFIPLALLLGGVGWVSTYEIPDDIEATSSTGLTSTTYNMEEAPRALTLPNAEAAQWNRDILLEFKAALEKNPAVDLISMFSDSYHRNKDYTEYTSLEFLAKQAPDVPAPRPHGLVAFGPFRVIFMSCIPGMTLTQAWPSLSHEEKLSIQGQLDEIFRRLRILRQDDGNVLGGVCGEGVKELRVDECALFKGITTAIKFNDLQFSAHHHGSSTYVEFLRSFLRNDRSTSMHESVFTHGDVRTDNIMVKQDPNGRYIVTGIIDWEYSGFYPEYYECTGLTRTLSLVDENDWYLYLPESISPSQFPVRWLVDRLWGTHLRTT